MFECVSEDFRKEHKKELRIITTRKCNMHTIIWLQWYCPEEILKYPCISYRISHTHAHRYTNTSAFTVLTVVYPAQRIQHTIARRKRTCKDIIYIFVYANFISVRVINKFSFSAQEKFIPCKLHIISSVFRLNSIQVVTLSHA